tara:strand:- start:1305 stop:1919 length:615 start_codon:yes stop_codon:yes gene_type:complete
MKRNSIMSIYSCFVGALSTGLIGLLGCAYQPDSTKTGLASNVSNIAIGNSYEAVAEDLVAVGYAVIDVQKGQTHPQRRLMAIRASKLDAYRNMAEQVYGVFLESTSQISEMKISAEGVRGKVQGLIYGSQLVSIRAIGRDSYETTLSLDPRVVDDLITRFRNGAAPRGSREEDRSKPQVKKLILTDASKPSWNFRKKRWERQIP